jgi:hypothetical protein
VSSRRAACPGSGFDFDSLSFVWTRSPRERGLGASISKNPYFRAPDGACAFSSVINLQHPDSFDMENSQTHKNTAIADGFCLLAFPKMALARMRRRWQWGLEIADREHGVQ